MRHASPKTSAARNARARKAPSVDILALLVIVAVLAAVVALVSAPLRGERVPRARAEADDDIAELAARKEAKYREIRDAELDHRMGKLSDADWRRVDRELRAEAIEILKRLDALH